MHCCTIKLWYWSDLIDYIWLQYIAIGISLVHSRGGVHSNSHVLIVGLCLVRGGLGRSFAVDVTWRDVTRPSWSMAGNHVLIHTNITSIHITFTRSWYKHCYTLDPIIDDSYRLLICPGRSFVPQNRPCQAIEAPGSKRRFLQIWFFPRMSSFQIFQIVLELGLGYLRLSWLYSVGLRGYWTVPFYLSPKINDFKSNQYQQGKQFETIYPVAEALVCQTMGACCIRDGWITKTVGSFFVIWKSRLAKQRQCISARVRVDATEDNRQTTASDNLIFWYEIVTSRRLASAT